MYVVCESNHAIYFKNNNNYVLKTNQAWGWADDKTR